MASSGGVIVQAVRDYDGFGWVLTVAEDGTNRRSLQTRSTAGGVTLLGRGGRAAGLDRHRWAGATRLDASGGACVGAGIASE